MNIRLLFWFLVVAACHAFCPNGEGIESRRQLNAELLKPVEPRMEFDGYRTQVIEGWTVRVSDGLRNQASEATEKVTKNFEYFIPVVDLDACKLLVSACPSRLFEYAFMRCPLGAGCVCLQSVFSVIRSYQ